MVGMRIAHKIRYKAKRQTSLGRPRCRWEDDIK